MSNTNTNQITRRSRISSYISIYQQHDNAICNYCVRDDIVKHVFVSRYQRYSTYNSSNVDKNVNFDFIDFQIYKPTNAVFDDLASRLATFDGWRDDIEQTPEMLADAGFFSTGNCIINIS